MPTKLMLKCKRDSILNMRYFHCPSKAMAKVK